MPAPSSRTPSVRARRAGSARVDLVVGLVLSPLVLLAYLRTGLGAQGVLEVSDHEVGVVVGPGGEAIAVDIPGFRLVRPVLDEPWVLDKRPRDLRMEGGPATAERGAGPRLLARAADGSRFSFDEVVVEYALRPRRAALLLADTGPDPAARDRLVRVLARAALRDELGRSTTEEIVDPARLGAAVRVASERLNERLAPHGLEVLQISTPKPRFAPDYEQAIERRKVGESEAERLRARLAQLRAKEELRRAGLARDEAAEAAAAARELAWSLEEARLATQRERRTADLYFAERESTGGREQYRLERAAAARRAAAELEHAGRLAQTAALAAAGSAAVKAALVESLAGVTFTLAPGEPAPPAAPSAAPRR